MSTLNKLQLEAGVNPALCRNGDRMTHMHITTL